MIGDKVDNVNENNYSRVVNDFGDEILTRLIIEVVSNNSFLLNLQIPTLDIQFFALSKTHKFARFVWVKSQSQISIGLSWDIFIKVNRLGEREVEEKICNNNKTNSIDLFLVLTYLQQRLWWLESLEEKNIRFFFSTSELKMESILMVSECVALRIV